MVGCFGDRVLGQMDPCSHGVLLFSGSCVLLCFSKRNSSGISKMNRRKKKKSQGNEIDHIKKIYEHLVPEHILLQTEGLIFEPHWCQRCGLLPSCGNPAKLDEHRRF